MTVSLQARGRDLSLEKKTLEGCFYSVFKLPPLVKKNLCSGKSFEPFTSTGSSSDCDLCVLRLGLIRFLLQPLGLHLSPELLLKLLLPEFSQLFGVCVRFRPDGVR